MPVRLHFRPLRSYFSVEHWETLKNNLMLQINSTTPSSGPIQKIKFQRKGSDFCYFFTLRTFYSATSLRSRSTIFGWYFSYNCLVGQSWRHWCLDWRNWLTNYYYYRDTFGYRYNRIICSFGIKIWHTRSQLHALISVSKNYLFAGHGTDFVHVRTMEIWIG